MLILAFVLAILLFIGTLLTLIFGFVFGVPSMIIGTITGRNRRFNLFRIAIPTIVFIAALIIIIKIAQMSILFNIFNLF